MTIKEKLAALPDRPGVYIMKNSAGKIIYVGKAKVLKNRVRQYFHASANHTPKVRAMVANIADFEFIITATEREAFVLECNLIKEYKPHYNILLKDSKTYPFIKISAGRYPKISFTRRTEKDGADYFGPYTSAYFCREMIEMTEKIFRLPTCNRRFPEDFGKKRPCLYYSMGRCMGVCTGQVSEEEYKKAISDAADFIKGHHGALIGRLEGEMTEAAQKLQFERAADLRDKINSIRYISEKQNVTILTGKDADVFAFAAEDNDLSFEVLHIRNGKMTGRESFPTEGAAGIDDGIIMENFLSQYYEDAPVVPPALIITATEPEDSAMLSDFLSAKRTSSVEIRFAQRGKYKELADMAVKNAEKTLHDIRESKMKKSLKKSAAAALGKLIGLNDPPSRIEAYDISHISGDAAVGAMIVFADGRYSKKDTRFFKISDENAGDDYASMNEVLTRRFRRCLSEYEKLSDGTLDPDEAKFSLLPDLILMDGGAGQVNIALSVLSSLGLSLPVYGMVKDERHRTRALLAPEGEIAINPTSPEFRLMTAIQDEVHRAAIGYHHRLREKSMAKSPLLSLKGVGEKIYEKLMRRFKTVSNIKKATLQELRDAVGKTAAEAIYDYYRQKK